MPSTVELLDYEYAFTSRWLMTPSSFLSYARSMGIGMGPDALTGLHRTGLLQPLLGVSRDVGAIESAVETEHPEAVRAFANSTTAHPKDLLALRAEARLFDPDAVEFTPPADLAEEILGIDFERTWFLYSAYQVIGLKDALQGLRLKDDSTHREDAVNAARSVRDVVCALLAFEARFHTLMTGAMPNIGIERFARFYEWTRDKGVSQAQFATLALNEDDAESAAKELVSAADLIDPLRDWLDLVSLMSPGRRKLLRGDALLALELRYAAEVLFRAAAETRDETVAEQDKRLAPDRFRPRRLASVDDLDAVLTRYGLSPHPSLLLVVEGETEARAIPKAMDILQISRRADFIRVVNRHGVGQPLAALLDHALIPYLSEPERDGRMTFHRPVTRMLVVTDPEGKLKTEDERADALRAWTRQIDETLPAGPKRASVARDLLADLVRIHTWDDLGNSFEFAHFTDEEIASAIESIDRRERQPHLAVRIESVAKLRSARKGLSGLLSDARTNKGRLGDVLLPLLYSRLEQVNLDDIGTCEIPIVRALVTAIRLAQEIPRSSMGLAPADR